MVKVEMHEFYTDEELKKIQACEMQIFKDFAKVCEENDLKYWGIGGTGIGAVRHKGYIPWDDDIDLAMPYDDYVKLNEIFMRDFKDKYTVVNGENFRDYPAMNEHILLNGTRFITNDAKHLKYPQGIFLDIFPHFKSSRDKTLRVKHGKSMWLWGKILILRQIPFPVIPFKGVKAKIVHCGTFVVSYLLKIIFPSGWLYKKNLKISLRYKDLDDYVYIFTSNSKYRDWYFEKDVSDHLQEYPFEDTVMYFPDNLDAYLKNTYGDYMKLPPADKRKTHAPILLEFPKE